MDNYRQIIFSVNDQRAYLFPALPELTPFMGAGKAPIHVNERLVRFMASRGGFSGLGEGNCTAIRGHPVSTSTKFSAYRPLHPLVTQPLTTVHP